MGEIWRWDIGNGAQEGLAMKVCLRCNKLYSATSVFCDDCRLYLQSQRQGKSAFGEERSSVAPHASIPEVLGSQKQQNMFAGEFSHYATVPLPMVQERQERTPFGQPLPVSQMPSFSVEQAVFPQAQQDVRLAQFPQTPSPDMPGTPELETPETAEGAGTHVLLVEHILHKLNDAARRIAAVEQKARRGPRASRLAPLRDISVEIQRLSTPMPLASRSAKSSSGDLGKKMPDLWPWLHDPDADEDENDDSANHTDPLLLRRFPRSSESARIEEEDMQRARADGLLAPATITRKKQQSRIRIIFFCLVVLAVLVLTIDSVLASFALLHPHRTTSITPGSPFLTFSLQGQTKESNIAAYGQNVVVHLHRFTPYASVLLTHDVQVAVAVANGSPLFQVDAQGAANVTMIIDSSWEPGFHSVYAEERAAHFTASAILQIAGSGPSRPSHLIISSTSLDLGPGYKGANTIQPLKLSNSGTSSITWSASSDKPWLMITPNQGTFSQSQTIAVGVQRANLKDNTSYQGKITFSSNVGSPQVVQVEMSVRAFPANTPVLTVTPAVLSFLALDGGGNPSEQDLVISNPGSQPLSWSLTNNTPTAQPNQSNAMTVLDSTNWLQLDRTTGMVVPGATNIIHVAVNSQNLLPGTYMNTLVFSAGSNAINSPQSVSVSLTIKPSCGLTISAGGITFTAVAGQSNPANQILGVSATSSCTGAIAWRAIVTTASSWLSLTPASGQLKGASSAVVGVAVDTTGMKAGTYGATVLLVAGQSTQSVLITLNVQNALPPSAPIMGVSPLNLNFSTTQGLASPPAQVVTITNTSNSTGGNALQWHTSVNQLATAWLGASPTGGSIAPGQTSQLTVTVMTTGLTPGLYQGQVVLQATYNNGQDNAGGSPQVVSVNLQVLPTCSLNQPSASSLAFSATQGGTAPASQSIVLTASGNCSWPLSWKSAVSSNAAWLGIGPVSGTLAASGQSTTLIVTPSINGLAPGTYTAQLTISALDISGVAAQGSPQVISISLVILQPCSLQATPGSLAFSTTQGQTSTTAQTVSFAESGSCARPISWTASGDANSTNWLLISSSSGTDNGTGSVISVNVNASNLLPGTYKGTITIAAVGSGSAVIQASPQVIPVTVVVSGVAVSGTVVACADQTCATPKPLPGAVVNVANSAGVTVISAAADASGNYILAGVALGSYTITASGTDTAGIHYSGNVTVKVIGLQSGTIINCYPATSATH